jgi:hypothetical protein
VERGRNLRSRDLTYIFTGAGSRLLSGPSSFRSSLSVINGPDNTVNMDLIFSNDGHGLTGDGYLRLAPGQGYVIDKDNPWSGAVVIGALGAGTIFGVEIEEV